MGYIKILEVFVLNILFSKNEYNVFHKNFKPVKVLVILFLVGNLFFSIYLINVIMKINSNVHEICPDVFKEDIPKIEPSEIVELSKIEEKEKASKNEKKKEVKKEDKK